MPNRLSETLLNQEVHLTSQPAVEDGRRTITYQKLGKMAWYLSQRLRQHGVSPGDIVGIRLRNTIEHCALLWAIPLVGGIIYPIASHDKENEIIKQIKPIKLKVIVVDTTLRNIAGFPLVVFETIIKRREGSFEFSRSLSERP